MSESLESMIYSARRTRFAELVEAWGGPKAFAQEVERRLKRYPEIGDGLTSFMDTSYISNAKNGNKNVGEAPALLLEFLFEKAPGWMSGDAYDNFLVRFRKRAG